MKTYVIHHYSDIEHGHASEYILPGGPILITSHYLGSGIYGLCKPVEGRKSYEFQFKNPFILSTNEEADKYSEFSRLLSKGVSDLVSGIYKYSLSEVYKKLEKSCYNPGFNGNKLFHSITEFIKDYEHSRISGKCVKMPINYVLENMGYDGIITKNTVYDSFSKGSIKFLPRHNHHNPKEVSGCETIKVMYLKARNGVKVSTYKRS